MSETNLAPNTTEKLKPAEATSVEIRDRGIECLLQAQSDLLTGAEETVSEWLHRRQEAVIDMQQLIARVQTGTDPAEAFKAQQEWMSRSLQRLSADVTACHFAAQQIMDRAVSWFPRDGWGWFYSAAGHAENADSQAAATRAAARPLRMANKPE